MLKRFETLLRRIVAEEVAASALAKPYILPGPDAAAAAEIGSALTRTSAKLDRLSQMAVSGGSKADSETHNASLIAAIAEAGNRIGHATSMLETFVVETRNARAEVANRLSHLDSLLSAMHGDASSKAVEQTARVTHLDGLLQSLRVEQSNYAAESANRAANLENVFQSLRLEEANKSGEQANRIAHLASALETVDAKAGNYAAQAAASVAEISRRVGELATPDALAHLANMIDTLKAEAENRALDDASRIGHLDSQVQSIRQENSNRWSDIEVMLTGLRRAIERQQAPDAQLAEKLLGSFSLIEGAWPPHKSREHENEQHGWLLQGVSEALARTVETLVGQASGPAASTRPIDDAQSDPDGPVVIACASLEAGGAERQAALTATGLARRGKRTVFVGHDLENRLSQHYFAHILARQGIPIENVALEPIAEFGKEPPGSVTRARLNSLPLGLGRPVASYLMAFRRLQPSLVHTWLDYTNVVAGLAALWAGVPRVVLGWRNINPSNYALYQPFFRPLYKQMLSDSRVRMVANSQEGARDYARWLEISPERVAIVPNAFEPSIHAAEQAARDQRRERPPPRQSETSPLILGVFRLYPEKDPLLFVRACALIGKALPAARFAIVGSGGLEDAIRAEARALGLGERLQLVGRQSNVIDWMGNANLLLHSARGEGLPNVLLEAQAAGLPVVATKAGGAVEAIIDGITGHIVDSRDPQRLCDAAVQALSSPAWLTTARSRGPEFIREHFGFDTMIDGTFAVYDSPAQVGHEAVGRHAAAARFAPQ